MKFIGAILGQIDAIWALWGIVAFPVVGYFMFEFLPFISLVIIFFIMKSYARDMALCNSMYIKYTDKSPYGCNDPEEAQLWKGSAEVTAFKALLILLLSACIFGVLIYWALEQKSICEDYSMYIPFTLPELVQKVVPHTCR